MIERIIIVILAILAIIFIPYWIGRLIIPKSKYSDIEDIAASWFLGALILTVFLFIIGFMILDILPWIINGSI